MTIDENQNDSDKDKVDSEKQDEGKPIFYNSHTLFYLLLSLKTIDEPQEIFEEEGLKVLRQQIKKESKMFDPCEDEMSEDWVNKNLRTVPKGILLTIFSFTFLH